jgi:hypothetical protein
MLSMAGIAFIVLIGQGRQSMHDVRSREIDAIDAAAILERHSLMDAVALDAMIGRKQVGRFDVETRRTGRALYTVAVVDTATRHDILSTSMIARQRNDTTR